MSSFTEIWSSFQIVGHFKILFYSASLKNQFEEAYKKFDVANKEWMVNFFSSWVRIWNFLFP